VEERRKKPAINCLPRGKKGCRNIPFSPSGTKMSGESFSLRTKERRAELQCINASEDLGLESVCHPE